MVINWRSVAELSYLKYRTAMGAALTPRWDQLSPQSQEAWIAAVKEAGDVVYRAATA
jgi:hypothetical protein